jgi:signal transduction histidine kinase
MGESTGMRQDDGNASRYVASGLADELENMKRLQEFSGLLIDDESDEPFDHILDTAIAIMRSDFASVQELDSERGALNLVAWKNFHPDAAEIWRVVSTENTTGFGFALRHGERAVVADVSEVDALRGTESMRAYMLSGIRAVQSTPLTTRGGRLLGVLSTHWRTVHVPRERELGLFDILARQVADFLERRRAQQAIRTNERRMLGVKQAFQAAINGGALDHSLHHLASIVTEELHGDARTAFYVADADHRCLHPVWGAGDMSESYTMQVDGFVVGADSLACGLATATGRPVLTADVFEDEKWNPWLHLARANDFRGCWSFPIAAADGTWIGTLALYFREARKPRTSELALADAVTQAASIIISRDGQALQRARAEEALREAQRMAIEEVERLVTQRTAERDELRRQLVGTEEAERRRLSRELHDQLGQNLTAFRLGLEDAARLLKANAVGPNAIDPRLVERIDQLHGLADQLMRSARYVALELRPPELDDVGLESALDTYVRAWSARYGVAAELTVTGLDDGRIVSSDVASTLYRIVQEALTNIAKHATATESNVIIHAVDGHIRLIIEDNGQGFDVDSLTERDQRDRRLGLSGMRERAALIGATFEVESSPGRGTTIYSRVPIPSS